jgi:WD40 repeat protein
MCPSCKGHFLQPRAEPYVTIRNIALCLSLRTSLLTLSLSLSLSSQVDISPKDPNRILSGSDDGTVKLWHTAQERSVATIQVYNLSARCSPFA